MRLWVAFLAFVVIAACGEGNLDFPGGDEAGLSGTETPGTETPGTETPGTETPTPEETPSATPTPNPSQTPGGGSPGTECVADFDECNGIFPPCCEESQCFPGLLLLMIPVPGTEEIPSFCLPIPAPPA